MGKTSIEWTDASWNPIVGCTEVSPGCANCYAARLAATRLRGTGQYAGLAHRLLERHADIGKGPAPTYTGPIRWTGEVRFLSERLEEPLHWRKPRRIFVCDMGDLFHEEVTDEQIRAVFKTIALGGGMGHTGQHHAHEFHIKASAAHQAGCAATPAAAGESGYARGWVRPGAVNRQNSLSVRTPSGLSPPRAGYRMHPRYSACFFACVAAPAVLDSPAM